MGYMLDLIPHPVTVAKKSLVRKPKNVMSSWTGILGGGVIQSILVVGYQPFGTPEHESFKICFCFSTK